MPPFLLSHFVTRVAAMAIYGTGGRAASSTEMRACVHIMARKTAKRCERNTHGRLAGELTSSSRCNEHQSHALIYAFQASTCGKMCTHARPRVQRAQTVTPAITRIPAAEARGEILHAVLGVSISGRIYQPLRSDDAQRWRPATAPGVVSEAGADALEMHLLSIKCTTP